MKYLFLIFILANSCSVPHLVGKRTPSYHLPAPHKTELSQHIRPLLEKHPGQSGYIPLIKGEDALVARIKAIREAQRTIDLQYYIWHDDLTGMLILKEILDAANRGVRIRLLLDNLNEAKYQTGFKVLSSHSQIEIRLVNPHFKYLNRRMHNKSFIVDNEIAIVGGRNIGDEYFDASEELNFGDYDMFMIGPVVNEVSIQFDQYWNHDRSYSIEEIQKKNIDKFDIVSAKKRMAQAFQEAQKTPYIKKLEATNFSYFLKLYWGKAHAVYDSPEKLKGKNINNLTTNLRPTLDSIQKELILISPYFIPGKKGMKTLKGLRKKGVRILVLTNSLASNDVASVFSGYQKYRKDLLESGVELYEVRSKGRPRGHKDHGSSSPSGLHGKVMIADRKIMFVGSKNLDPRSLNLNSEMGIMVEDPKLAEDTATGLIQKLPEVAYKLEFKNKKLRWIEEKKMWEVEPETTWWMRTKVWFSSLIVPEELL